jgi:hypothetical protein
VRASILIPLLAAVVGSGGATEAAHAGQLRDEAPYTVTRAWAGFVERAGEQPYTAVRATWTIPRIVCNRPSSSVAFWVGLGGATSRSHALEQIGTSVDCSDRAVASYSAWYEAYPAAAVDIAVTVRPGEAVTAAVRVAGNVVDMSLVNESTGASFAKQLTMPAPETDSAEWIVEAPSSCLGPVCAPLPLAHFGRVTFGSATATVGDRKYALGDPRLTMELFAVVRHRDVAVRPLAPKPWLAAGSVLG